MNQELQELWQQCVAKHTKTPMNWQVVANEFAQVIIAKCMHIARDSDVTQYSDFRNGIAQQIKQHFEIEESRGWRCSKCDTDRTKHPCPFDQMAAGCPMVITAYKVVD